MSNERPQHNTDPESFVELPHFSRAGDDTRIVNPGSTAQPAATLGHYTIQGRIGKGGMGEVLLGWDAALKRKVALKIIPPDMAAHPHFIERFNREAQAVAALNHPNIINIYYFGQDAGRLFFAMEFVDGESVDRKVETLGRLDLIEAVRITIQAAEALRYASSRGIIHRDIKPSNLLIDKEGTVKLADFGLAKMTSGGVDGSLTTTGAIIGSPLFMSPEQAQGRPVDFRSDMYSLGCTLFFLASGKPPYWGDSAISILVMHVQEPLPEPPILAGAVDGRLMQVIRRMMAKMPEGRHETYDELLAELKEVERSLTAESGIGGIPTTFKSSATAKPAGAKSGKANYLLYGVIGILVVVILLAGVIVAVNSMSSSPPATSTSQPSAVTSNGAAPAAPALPSNSSPTIPDPMSLPAPMTDRNVEHQHLDAVPSFIEVQASLRYAQEKVPEALRHLDNYNFIGTAQIVNQTTNAANMTADDRLAHARLLRLLTAIGPLRRDLPREVAAAVPMTVQSDNGPVTITAVSERSLAARSANGAQYNFQWNTRELPAPIFLQLAKRVFGGKNDEDTDIRLILFAMLYQLDEHKAMIADFEKTHGKSFAECNFPQALLVPSSSMRPGSGAGQPGVQGGQNRPGGPNAQPRRPQ